MVQKGEIFLGGENGILYHTRTPAPGKWSRDQVGSFLTGMGASEDGRGIAGIFEGKSGPYVSLIEGGFWKKIPGSAFWQPLHTTLKSDFVYDVLETPEGTLYVCCDKGVFRSKDGSRTWELLYQKEHAGQISLQNGALLLSTRVGILRSTDEGANWENVLSETEHIYDLHALSNGQIAVLCTRPSNQPQQEKTHLYLSSDGGRSWQRIGQDQNLVTRLESTLSEAGRIYDIEQVGTSLFCSHAQGVSRSSDGGMTWELVLPMEPVRENICYDLIVSEGVIWAAPVFVGC